MKPVKSWPRISSAVNYDDAAKAIDWLCEAFGFEVRLKIAADDGKIQHSELTFGEGVVMVADVNVPSKRPQPRRKSPSQVNGANTQSLFVYVDDIEAHFQRARAAGATIVSEPTTTDYGEGYWVDRGYECVDLGGHGWYFAQRMKD